MNSLFRDPVLESEIIQIPADEFGNTRSAVQVTFMAARAYEVCGLCGQRERVNELGEFMYLCQRTLQEKYVKSQTR